MHDIAVTSPSFCRNPVLRDELLGLVREVRFNETGKSLMGDELFNFLRNARAAIVGLERIDQALLQKCPQLKAIAKYGVGLDNIDLEACKQRQIEVGWTAGVNAYAVAEQTLGMMIALCRNLFSGATKLRNGQWLKDGGFELRGKTLGLIGVGAVGSEVARLASAFGAKLLLNDIKSVDSLAQLYKGQCTSKDEIYQTADIISLHVPLTPETRQMIGSKELRAMKPSAIFINTSRGEVVDQSALKQALKDRRIGGAALDVYIEEPCLDTDLTTLDNIICTPHICGNSIEANLAMGRAAIANLKRMISL